MRSRVFVALAAGVAVVSLTGGVARAADPEPGAVVSMSAFKCIEFLSLQETDPEAATAMVRWVDGWHAAGADDMRFTETDYVKLVDGVISACYHYPRRSLIKVMAGKYR